MNKTMAPLENLTPATIVTELDRYIIGQKEAKRSVAIALRNRWRRQRVLDSLRDEIFPKNILMIGPTGVGKTEIARRLAKLVHAPFVKVEATKYTEVGYVGKDVESMIRDLVETAINMVKSQEKEQVLPRAKELAEERLLDLLVPVSLPGETADISSREKHRNRLRAGDFEQDEVTLDSREKQHAVLEVFTIPGMEEMDTNLRDVLGNMLPKKNLRRTVKVIEARRILEQEEASKLVDMDRVIPRAIQLAEQMGIIFLDEMDKIAESREGVRNQAAVSREGVQRDLLPIVEGSNVTTKYGIVKTDHILFIGAGAFHQSKPADLIPELQGRFPIRVELTSLSTDDFYQILTAPKNSLLKQYVSLLKTENVTLVFQEEAVRKISSIATLVNERTENIGARRLHTILEKVIEDISFDAPNLCGEKVEITAEYVEQRVGGLAKNQDLSRYIL
jgi:ATP-dependent HslUV protease ATP-binding subunit HslU